MQTVKASTILDDAYRRIGWDANQLDTRDKQDARNAFSLALQEVWEAWWWAELMECNQVQCAPTYSAASPPDKGQTVYWAQTEGYYTSLIDDNTNNPMNANDDVQAAYWFEWEQDFDPDEWVSTRAYVQGDTVAYLGTNYQCVAATSTGTTPSALTDWLAITAWEPEFPYQTFAGTYVLNDGNYTGPFGPVRSVSQLDPRETDNPGEFETEGVIDGTRIIGLTVGKPWVWSRLTTPVITGDDYASTTSYEAITPDQAVNSGAYSAQVLMHAGTMVALTAGTSSGSVTYSLVTTPTAVQLNVTCPSGGELLTAHLVNGTLTSTGFDYYLSGTVPTPATGYYLSYSLEYSTT